MGSSPSPPPAYNNPSTVIPQSQQANYQTAQEQAELNNVSQYNPMGSSVYTSNGNGGYDLTQSLSPQMQGIFNSATGAAGSLGQQAQNQYSQPANINPSSAVNSAVGMYQQYMDPYWQQQQSNLNSNLESQGLNPNDQAYKMAQLGLQQGQQSQVGQEIATLEPQMYQQALQSYELPAQMLGQMEGEIPGAPSTINTPQTGVSPTDVSGVYDQYQAALNQQYQSQMQNYSSMMGGLFGLGSTAMLLPFLSDGLMKRESVYLYTRPDGIQVWKYRHAGRDGRVYIGAMAEQVEKVRPDAIINDGQTKIVDYRKLGFGRERIGA